MTINPISFRASEEQINVSNRLKNANEEIIYTQKINPDDNKSTVAAKSLHNYMSLEKYDDLEDDEILNAMCHNAIATAVNPLLMVPNMVNTLNLSNRYLLDQKANETYKQNK